jgi:hypothetical protein
MKYASVELVVGVPEFKRISHAVAMRR